MTLKSSTKNKESNNEMEKNITPIFVMNNKALKPYMELFEYHPENIYQQPLGSLVGFFEIKEYSEDSAYIVNFLTSVLKKEYYINPKREVTESLDSALHKVNIALSEIVKNGNTNWLGKLDGAVCVLEKHSIHFSVAGNAHIFLHRNLSLSNISEGLASDICEIHPLKTFVNVSSGRIEKDDKIVIFSDEVFHIFNENQLKKNIERFKSEDFIQFLKTALGNELEMTAAIVVDVAKSKPAEKKRITVQKSQQAEFNAFSEKTFAKSEDILSTQEINDSLEVGTLEKEYTDQKTGHIYIQGEEESLIKESKTQLLLISAKEHISDLAFQSKDLYKRKFSIAKKSVLKSLTQFKQDLEKKKEIKAKKQKELQKEREELEEQQLKLVEESRLLEENKPIQESLPETVFIEEEILPVEEKEIKHKPSKPFLDQITITKPKIEENLVNNIEAEDVESSFTLQKKIERARLSMDDRIERMMADTKIGVLKNDSIADKSKENLLGFLKKLQVLFNENNKSILKNKLRVFKKTLFRSKPNFSKIKNLFERFSSKQKISVLVFIFIIIFTPLIIDKLGIFKEEPKIVEIPTPEPTLSQILAGEKNIALSTQLNQILTQNELVTAVIYDKNPYFVGKQKITSLHEGAVKEFALPAQSGNATNAVFMNDLNLILILTDQNKIISFSPISQQFQDNSIQLPSANNKFLGTYLTYLYIPDESTNQIYRFPRATGGFGEKLNWLKDDTSLTNISAMTIDDGVYFVSDNKIIKLFKGKKVDLNFEQSKTPINFNQIYTNTDSSFIYALDTKNNRLVQFSKDGFIVSQYFNESLNDAISFIVDEKIKTAYIITSKGAVSLAL